MEKIMCLKLPIKCFKKIIIFVKVKANKLIKYNKIKKKNRFKSYFLNDDNIWVSFSYLFVLI